jgi:DNA-binding FadR family transcriptional regulator
VGSFHDSVVDTLAGWIVSARFPAGAALPVEPAICAELGASRTTVREALKTLAAKGLVRIGPRTGTRVRPADDWSLLDPQVVEWRLKAPLTPALVNDLVEMRLLIEPSAAALAAERAQGPDVARIREAFDAMERAVDGEGSYIEADLAFHEAILRAAGNQFLSQLAPVVGAVLRLSFKLSVTSLESARLSLPGHAAVLRAVAAAKPEEARTHLTRIIEASKRDMAYVGQDAPLRRAMIGA